MVHPDVLLPEVAFKLLAEDAVGLIGQQRHRHALAGGGKIRAEGLHPRGGHQDHRALPQGVGGQLVPQPPNVLVKDPHVQCPGQQAVPNVVAVHGLDEEPRPRDLPVKGLQHRGQAVAQQGLRHADGNVPPALGQVLLEKTHLVHRVQHLVHIGQQPLARLAEDHPPPHLFKQLGGELPLQLPHLKGDGGLGVVQALRRPGEATLLHNGTEGVEVLEIHHPHSIQ